MKKELVALLTVGAVMVSGGGTALAAEVTPNGQGMVLSSGFQGPVMRLEDLAFEVLADSPLEEASLGQTRATESLTWTIRAGKTSKAATSFPMEAGETVTFHCTYSPRSATVDFGLIAPDNKFYYLSGKDGGIDQTVEIPERGDYYLAIRNRSTTSVEVTGFVNY